MAGETAIHHYVIPCPGTFEISIMYKLLHKSTVFTLLFTAFMRVQLQPTNESEDYNHHIVQIMHICCWNVFTCPSVSRTNYQPVKFYISQDSIDFSLNRGIKYSWSWKYLKYFVNISRCIGTTRLEYTAFLNT